MSSRRKLGRLAGLACLLAAAGCGVPMTSAGIHAQLERDMAEARAGYVVDHPELPDSIAGAIRDGRVLVGMTSEQATVAWAIFGPPWQINRTSTQAGSSDQYVFRRMRSLYDYEYAYSTSSAVVSRRCRRRRAASGG